MFQAYVGLQCDSVDIKSPILKVGKFACLLCTHEGNYIHSEETEHTIRCINCGGTMCKVKKVIKDHCQELICLACGIVQSYIYIKYDKFGDTGYDNISCVDCGGKLC